MVTNKYRGKIKHWTIKQGQAEASNDNALQTKDYFFNQFCAYEVKGKKRTLFKQCGKDYLNHLLKTQVAERAQRRGH